MKQEFNESVDQVAGRDIINVYGSGVGQAKNKQGYICPYCKNFVQKGALICSAPSCGAELIYGSTRDERSRNFSIGFTVCAVLSAAAIYRLPIELNDRFGFEIPELLGMNMTTYPAAFFIAGIVGGFLNQAIKQSMRIKSGPRFIRMMRH